VGRAHGLAAIAVAVAVLGGCSGSGGSGGSAATTTSRRTPTTVGPSRPTSTRPAANLEDAPGALFTAGWPKGSGGECAGQQPGRAGVVMTFCHGPATVTVTLPDGAHTLRGVCWFNGSTLEVDAGVTVGRAFSGPWPDYVTMQLPSSAGPVDQTFVAWIDGRQHLVETAFGTMVEPKTASGAPIPPGTVSGRDLTIDAKGYSGTDQATDALHVACG